MSTTDHRETLTRALSLFQAKVNQHPRLRTLLQGWDRDLVIECDDVELSQALHVRGSLISDASDATPHADVTITMRASHPVLVDVFEGRRSPAKLFLDGDLQVFASDKDQVKLDAISLLLWD
jgi:hypothetical protein